MKSYNASSQPPDEEDKWFSPADLSSPAEKLDPKSLPPGVDLNPDWSPETARRHYPTVTPFGNPSKNPTPSPSKSRVEVPSPASTKSKLDWIGRTNWMIEIANQLSGSQYKVLHYLTWKCGDREGFRISQTEIVKKLGISKSSFKEIQKSLVDLGFLKIDRAPRKQNRYTVLYIDPENPMEC